LPVVPRVFGFDPRTQFIHEDDGIEVLRRSVVDNHRGTFNVAGEGVLLLSQAIRRAGRVSVQIPSPAVSLVGSVFRRAGVVDFSPEQMQFLQFGRGVDTTRLREDFGYQPRYRTLEAFDDFVHGRALTRYVDPERVARVEHMVLAGVDRGRTVHA
jgi:UDP-glucose 4-epimerase